MDLKTLLLTCLLVIITMTVMTSAMNRSDNVQCLRWQSDATSYPGYYLTKWQKMQCDAHNIQINAPVR